MNRGDLCVQRECVFECMCMCVHRDLEAPRDAVLLCVAAPPVGSGSPLRGCLGPVSPRHTVPGTLTKSALPVGSVRKRHVCSSCEVVARR